MLKAKIKTDLRINLLVAISLLGLSACGGSSGGFSGDVIDGVFKDSNVTGLDFVSGGEEGITGENGEFTFEEGEDVSFSIGGVDLGKGKGKPVMTPVDLVEDGTLASDEAINKVRFLMMLDENNKPTDGIMISEAVREKAKEWKTIDFASENFPTADVYKIINQASLADTKEHELPKKDAAVTHLKTTLICSSSGAYAGTYTGSEKGKIVLVVNPSTGEVIGSTLKDDTALPLEASNTTNVDYDDEFKFVSTDTAGKKFTGKMASSDEMVGSWTSTENADLKGSFSGDRIGGKNDALYRYTATFKSNNGKKSGIYAFDVDDSNDITGISYDVATKKESELSGSITDNKFTVEAEDGTQITGFIDDTLSVTGTWINNDEQAVGSLEGGGCRLN